MSHAASPSNLRSLSDRLSTGVTEGQQGHIEPKLAPAGAGFAKPASGAHPKFVGNTAFQSDLHARVDAYFEQTGKSKRDCWQMYLKTAFYLGGFAASYVALVFFAAAWWQAIPLAILVGLFVAGIGMNIQHDGSHQAYSDKPWINKLAAMSLELGGGSCYYWRHQHTILHHTYTNVSGHDHDVDIGIFGRLTPHQEHRSFHRAQHLYMWFLYAFMAIRWQLFGDIWYAVRGGIGAHKIPRPKGWDLAVMVLGKLVFLTLAFVIPMMYHPWYSVVGCYLLAGGTLGLVLAVVFQLAHAVEDAEFVLPTDANRIENAWAIHQAESTVDFARSSKAAAFLLGGLNYQIEHHLFPRICHLHYPQLTKIVEQTCKDHGVVFNEHRTFWSGVGSHYRWLKQMGKKPEAALA